MRVVLHNIRAISCDLTLVGINTTGYTLITLVVVWYLVS